MFCNFPVFNFFTMYFAWLYFYTSSLVWLALVGIALSIYQLTSMSIENFATPFYCVFICIWLSVMNQMWRRRENELAFVWNTSSYNGRDNEREEFQSQLVLHPYTLQINRLSFQRTLLRTVFLTIPTILFGLALIVAAFIGYRLWSHVSSSLTNTVVVGAVNGVGITILTYVYYYIAELLTNWENHQFIEDYENSYIIKIFGFQFVNCYISLFAIAFYDIDTKDLAYSMVSIFVVKNFLTNITELILPIFWHKYKISKLEKAWAEQHPDGEDERKRELDRNYTKFVPSEILFEYCEMFIQLGYMTLFSSVLPAAPILSILNNLWEIGGEAKIHFEYNRRPDAVNARDIGSWNQIMKFMIIVTIIVNAGFIYVSSKKSKKSFYSILNMKELLILLLIVIIFEHVLLFINYIIETAIPNKPEDIRKEEIFRKVIQKKVKSSGGLNKDLSRQSVLMTAFARNSYREAEEKKES